MLICKCKLCSNCPKKTEDLAAIISGFFLASSSLLPRSAARTSRMPCDKPSNDNPRHCRRCLLFHEHRCGDMSNSIQIRGDCARKAAVEQAERGACTQGILCHAFGCFHVIIALHNIAHVKKTSWTMHRLK